jgi:hypothetical protein
MPQVLGYATWAVLGKAALAFVGRVLLTAVVGSALSKLLGKPKGAVPGSDRSVTIRGTLQPRSLIYGQVRTGGFMAFVASTGTYSEVLVFAVAFAGHQCEEISDIWLDGLRIPSADINASTGVVTGFSVDSVQKLYIWKHLGAHNQTADSYLDTLFTEWTSDHRGNGIPYIVVAMASDDNLFPMGAPSNIFAMVKGRRLYDPRLDSTNGGSGSHRYTDATTWAWSNNPVLCRRDYITGGSRTYSTATPDNRLGLAESNSRIDDAIVTAQANICDELVLIPPASPTTHQARYTCDVELSCGNTHRENIDILEACCIGNTSVVGGKIRINAGAFNTPTVTITADDVIDGMSVNTHNVGEDTYNYIIPEFYDEAQNYQLTPGPGRTQSTYQTDDGQLLPRTIELHAVKDSYRAQRIANIHLEMTRLQTNVVFNGLSPNAINIAQNELFNATLAEYTWTAQAIRCNKWAFLMQNGMVKIEGRLESASVWNDLAVADYVVPGTTGTDGAQVELPVPPNALTVTSYANTIGIVVGFATTPLAGTIVEIWEHTSSSPFSSATRIAFSTTPSFVIQKNDTTQRYYWATTRLNGQRSTNYPASTGTSGRALPALQATSLTITGIAGGIVASWAASSSQPPGTVWELFRYSANTPFASASKIWEGDGLSVTIIRDTPAAEYYWVRARTNGTNGVEYPSGNGVSGQGLAPVAPTSLTLLGFPTYIRATVGGSFAAGTIVKVFEYTANTPFASATEIARGVNQTVFMIPRRDAITRYYWVATELSGIASTNYPSGNGTAGASDLTATTDIDEDGITEAFGVDNAGPNNYYNPYGAFLVSATIGPYAFDTIIDCTATFNAAAITTGAGKAANGWAKLSSIDSVAGTLDGIEQALVTAYSNPYSVQYSFPMAAGATTAIWLRVQGISIFPTNPVACTDGHLLALVRKR